MTVALDIDGVLCGFVEFYDFRYVAYAKEHNMSYSTLIKKQHYPLHPRYGMSRNDTFAMHEDLFPLYCASPLYDGAVEFVQKLHDAKILDCLLTHRYLQHRESTYSQMSPILSKVDVPIIFATDNKSLYMEKRNIDLLVDDADGVILDVLYTLGERVIAPKRDYNQGLNVPYYQDYDEAFEMIQRRLL